MLEIRQADSRGEQFLHGLDALRNYFIDAQDFVRGEIVRTHDSLAREAIVQQNLTAANRATAAANQESRHNREENDRFRDQKGEHPSIKDKR